MFEAIQLELQALGRGRPIKFTPERMQQISNLVDRGKSPDQIAEVIGITTDTLQVACSKLGISLRRHTSRSEKPKLQHRPKGSGGRDPIIRPQRSWPSECTTRMRNDQLTYPLIR
jgi:hypothetical protein